ncbi:proteasome maturation protein [Teleopsis dalmanni]|uniref:proteasome maturation protein n=1 Tax=Teleopsis dalmanni TaxID=139649 RepID=UPI0018CC9C86|nr:proteasome maturation protein [Teleopsis dalmanni]
MDPISSATTLNVTGKPGGPSEPNCLMQLEQIHDLQNVQAKFDDHAVNMMVLRNQGGLAEVLKLNMELKSAKRIGRLPFLQSSHMMEDVILGRDEAINFDDFIGVPEFFEYNRNPMRVMEKTLGI